MIVDNINKWVIMGLVGKEIGTKLGLKLELCLELGNEVGDKLCLVLCFNLELEHVKVGFELKQKHGFSMEIHPKEFGFKIGVVLYMIFRVGTYLGT